MTDTTFVLSKDQYELFNEKFATAAKAKSLTAGNMILNNILRNKDVRRGFTPITNRSKLAHGMNAWQGFIDARTQLVHDVRWGRKALKEKFGLDLTDEMADEIARIAKEA
jgi:hypothetical protein